MLATDVDEVTIIGELGRVSLDGLKQYREDWRGH